MKLHDALWGALLLGFAGALYWHASGFPAMSGQQVGPGALPRLLAVGLGVCGALLLVQGLRRRVRGGTQAWLKWPRWLGAPRQLAGFVVLVAVNLLYLLTVERLGFIVVGSVYLAALMLVLRVRPLRALIIAVVMTLLIHGAFYKLLKVPLPWGVLPVLW